MTLSLHPESVPSSRYANGAKLLMLRVVVLMSPSTSPLQAKDERCESEWANVSDPSGLACSKIAVLIWKNAHCYQILTSNCWGLLNHLANAQRFGGSAM